MNLTKIEIQDKIDKVRDDIVNAIPNAWPDSGHVLKAEDIQDIIKDAFDAGSRVTLQAIGKQESD